MTAPAWTLRRLHALDDAQIGQLADVLIDCVDGGASVSFMLPLTRERAVAFWRRVARDVAAGGRALLVAEDAQGVCGTVQLVLDQPENQPHRADLSKMLVHHRARRQGLGAALMRAAETTAEECGKTLLVLDAVTDGDAARLYERLGWVRVGVIPDYALFPRGGFCDTTVYYRTLRTHTGTPMTSNSPVPSGATERAQPESFRAKSLAASLTVNDLQASLAWYRDVVGFTVHEQYEREGKLVAVSLKAGAVQFLLGQDNGAKGLNRVKGAGFSLQITTSQNIDQLADRIKARGGVLLSGPDDVYGARAFRLQDLDGFILVISSERQAA